MSKNDEIIVRASKHFKLNNDGLLGRESLANNQDPNRTKLGVGVGRANKKGYVCFSHRDEESKRNFTLLSHRMVFYLYNGFLPEHVDHIDNDPSNNHPSNLRAATPKQNSRNRKKRKVCTSRFLGVHQCKYTKKWIAMIKNGRRQKNLGCFDSEVEAASHYNLAAIELFGEFANLNNLR